MTKEQTKPEGRRLQVLSSGQRARRTVELNGDVHEGQVANPNRSLSYAYGIAPA